MLWSVGEIRTLMHEQSHVISWGRLLVNEIEGKLLNFWMHSWVIGHRKPFNADKESITTNARMCWMKFYFCAKIPGHWQPGLLTNFQLWKYKVSAFLNTVKTFKTLSDHSESDSSMKIRLYPRLISLVLFWTASFPAMFKVTLQWLKL